MPRRPLSDSPMTNAERQARHRAARAAAGPVVHYRRPADRRSRAQRWHEAVAVLIAFQAEYRTWLQALPDNLQESATAQALQAIDDLDLDELALSSRRAALAATDPEGADRPLACLRAERADARSVTKPVRLQASVHRTSVGRCATPGAPRPPAVRPPR